MKQTIQLLIAGLLITLLGGCGGSNAEGFLNDIEELKQENSKLSDQVMTLHNENLQLREQSTTLLSMKRETRLELIDTLESIAIGDRTGIYDKNENGTLETLAIYLTPLDNQADAVKAIGTCRIELWDLCQPEQEAKVIRYTFEPSELNQNWGGNIFNSYYRLELDNEDIEDHILLKKPKQLTLKITFTDYIAGKTLTAQKLITLN